jgi:hypothetical protein
MLEMFDGIFLFDENKNEMGWFHARSAQKKKGVTCISA